MRARIASLVVLLLASSIGFGADEKPLLRPGQRVVFLGDSITHAGHFVALVEARLRTLHPESSFDLINLGLPSETLSGLSEPDHPFPRPDLHERLDRALAKAKPDLVVACYGVNDGIYYPFSKTRFTAYKKGVDKLIEKVRKAKAELILMTPPPFDPLPMRKKGKLRAAGSQKFAWFAIYEAYDAEVMTKYAAWILEQRKRVLAVVDLRTPILAHVRKQREKKPDFALSSDGIHLNADGHRIIANTLLEAARISKGRTGKQVERLVEKRTTLIRDAWLSHVGHKRPGVKKGLGMTALAEKLVKIDADLKARLGGAKN
jgi:lysophospholipase L1-like esterase